nr:helitron helicase-like domain-containing protein [Tanacetum cinerariifolium]
MSNTNIPVTSSACLQRKGDPIDKAVETTIGLSVGNTISKATPCNRHGNRPYLPKESISVSKRRIILRPPPKYPQYIKELYEDVHFMDNIRAYNQMFSMTSLGANIDKSINNGKGPYVFRISELKKEIVEGLIEFLDNHNALVQLFQTARNKHIDADVLEFKVRHYNVIGTRQYELPTSETIGAIVFGDSSITENKFDLIIEEHSQFPQRAIRAIYMLITLMRLQFSEYMGARIFITFTCNTKWPEIKEFMKPFPQLTVADRADIVDHVFENKVRDYIAFVYDSKTFGTVVGELPNPVIDPHTYAIISELMIHGPCGFANPTALCMKDGGTCNRNFLKSYCNKTNIDKEGFVHYHRRDTEIQVQRQHVWLDNRRYTYGRHLTYLNFTSDDAWHAADRYWQRHIRNIDNKIYPTNKAACQALGLISSDQEWVTALEEAILFATTSKLIKLFVYILIFCNVSDPVKLWNNIWKNLSDDIARILSKSLRLPQIQADEKKIQNKHPFRP